MPAVYRFRGFTLDMAAGALSGPQSVVPLRPKALALLELLVRNPGRALGKDEMLDAVWPGVTVSDETLTQTVHELRRGPADDSQTLIRTVPRRGYLFPVEALETGPHGQRALALRPFENLSSDPEQDFFAAGLRLDLESALGLVRGLELRANRATADFELTGSVRAAAGRIRVTARLAGTADGRQLWSGRFDGHADSIFALQDEITRKVAVAMQVELTRGDSARLWDGQTASLAAWERYIVAFGLYLRWSEADISRARDLLREALEIDPDYVAAKVLLAKTWWYDARFYTRGDSRTKALAEAERLAREVLDRFPEAASALMTLGGVAWLRDDHDLATALCRRASELSPSDAWVLGFYGMILTYSGEMAQAMTILSRAAHLSPQTTNWIDYHIGHARAWAGDDAGARTCFQGYVTAEPLDPWGYVMLALTHGLAGRNEEARSAVAEAIRQKPDLDLDQVRRSQRHRDPARLETVITLLKEAGLPE